MSARIEIIDGARGLALVAMTIFHFAFDLHLFGFTEPGSIFEPHWVYFARAIASTFLFLTGVSLFLAHKDGFRWPDWRIRMIKIIASAMLISAATFLATPEQYIFFGILHQIAFASVMGLLFLSLPVVLTLLTAVVAFWIGQYVHLAILDHPFWYWTGLSQIIPTSSDYVPIFPWFSASLAGIAFAKLCYQGGWLKHLAFPQLNHPIGRGLKFLGRNSLIYYLLHQPIMIALIFAFAWMLEN